MSGTVLPRVVLGALLSVTAPRGGTTGTPLRPKSPSGCAWAAGLSSPCGHVEMVPRPPVAPGARRSQDGVASATCCAGLRGPGGPPLTPQGLLEGDRSSAPPGPCGEPTP